MKRKSAKECTKRVKENQSLGTSEENSLKRVKKKRSEIKSA